MIIRLQAMLAAAAAAVLALGVSVPARAQETAYLTVQGGMFDVFDGDHDTGAFAAEYRFGEKFYFVKPFVGMLATFKGSVYGYVGLLTDIRLLPNLVVTPSLAVGAYHEGGGKDLGAVQEFRSGIEIAYEFRNGQRIGMLLHHISNASTGDKNPGAETLMLTYSIPLGK